MGSLASYRKDGITYVKWDADDYVSADWHVILSDLVRNGVPVLLGDGHRSMGLQRARVRQFGLYHPVRNPRGAAAPSATAPHVRLGRPDHALDLDTGVVDRIIRECQARYGLRLKRTVRKEPWHVEAIDGPAALREAAHRARWAGYTLTEQRMIREYDDLKRRKTNIKRRRELRDAMTEQRKRIWRAAQGPGGWNRANRRARYESLRARTT